MPPNYLIHFINVILASASSWKDILDQSQASRLTSPYSFYPIKERNTVVLASFPVHVHFASLIPSPYAFSQPSYLTYVIRCNRCNWYSFCNHSVYTTFTQWLHHPRFSCLDAQVSTLCSCSLVPRLHPPWCICCLYTILSNM